MVRCTSLLSQLIGVFSNLVGVKMAPNLKIQSPGSAARREWARKIARRRCAAAAEWLAI
jgi:hypothetical protein